MANGTGDGADNKGEIQVIVRTLAIALLACLLGDFFLLYVGKAIPTELWLLTSNCFTALATMLVKTSPTASAPPDRPKPSGDIKVAEQKLETTT